MRNAILRASSLLALVLILGCGEDGSGLSSASMGGATSPSSASVPPSAAMGGATEPVLGAVAVGPSLAPAPVVVGSSGCSENDLACACYLVFDLASACGLDTSYADRSMCASLGEVSDYYSSICAAAGLNSSECWSTSLGWIERCLGGQCEQLCRNFFEPEEKCVCDQGSCELDFERERCDCQPRCCKDIMCPWD